MGKAGSVKAAATTKLNFFLLAKCFDRVVAVSKTLAEELVHRYGIRPGKIETIHNGIPFPEIRNKEIHVDLFIIGSAGRFAPVKDYSLMVDIARSVSEKIDTVKFKLAGDGPELQKLQALVKEYGLSERFEFTGFISNLDSFYSGLDLYINTSFHEGIPMSVLEAMAQGLPVVAPKVGGFPEIITDGMEGYLIEGRNPAAFADKCILLASNNDLREEMSKAAQKKIENQFSADRMASRYYELYKMVASA
jgi:glycosyltransferase involved in cell wall biosynthesis